MFYHHQILHIFTTLLAITLSFFDGFGGLGKLQEGVNGVIAFTANG